jgi:uncharacterized membrane protein YeaQ/YmgE (transglycosylase-associated protein family)
MTGALLWWIGAGLIVGAESKGIGYGLPTDLVVGAVGAMIGGWTTSVVASLGKNEILPSIYGALLGAAVLLRILRVLNSGKTKKAVSSREET